MCLQGCAYLQYIQGWPCDFPCWNLVWSGWTKCFEEQKKKKLLFHYCVCGLWPGSHRQCEHSLFVSLLSSPSRGVIQWLHSPLSVKIQSTILQSSLRRPSLQWHAFGHCVAQISRVTIELLAFKLENIHWPVEKVSSSDNPMQRERPGPAGEMCPSFIQPYSPTSSMFVHNTSPQQTLTRVRRSAVDSQKCPLPGGKEPSQSCTPELPHEHARSSWGAAPAPTPMALPRDAVRLPSHCAVLWTQSSAIVIQLPQWAMIHSPVSHLHPCHACQVLGLLQRRASSTCRKETSAWLCSPSSLCPGSCFPASR